MKKIVSFLVIILITVSAVIISAAPATSATTTPVFGNPAQPLSLPSGCSSGTALTTSGIYTPSQVAAHYGLNQVLQQGFTGSGLTVWLIDTNFNYQSVKNFDSCYGLNINNIDVTNYVHWNSGAVSSGTLDMESETSLDVEMIQIAAPAAKIIIENGSPATLPFGDIVSSSLGFGEACTPTTGLSTLYENLGVPQFQATGDQGSTECLDLKNSPTPYKLATSENADNPYATSVGGTTITNISSSSGLGDVVWNSCEGTTGTACAQNGGGAGGGGLGLQAEPSWQLEAVGALGGGCGSSGNCLGTPDISVVGNPQTVINSPLNTSGQVGWQITGGTSEGTPLMAAMAADIQQSCNSEITNFSPNLFGFFHDFGYDGEIQPVLSGNNDLANINNDTTYQASDGYNLATGLGVPVAYNLLCPNEVSLENNSGIPGSEIAINGRDMKYVNSVMFGNTPATIDQTTTNSVVVTIPQGITGTVPVTVSNPMGSAAPVNFESLAPYYTEAPPKTATITVGKPVNITFSAWGDPTYIQLGKLPSGLSFTQSQGNGVISGTPTSSGVYSIQISGYNDAGFLPETTTVINVDTPPTISTVSSLVLSPGEAVNIPVSITGFPAPTLTSSGLPAGLSINNDVITGEVTTPISITFAQITAANPAGSTTQLIELSSPPSTTTTTTPVVVTTTPITTTTIATKTSNLTTTTTGTINAGSTKTGTVLPQISGNIVIAKTVTVKKNKAVISYLCTQTTCVGQDQVFYRHFYFLKRHGRFVLRHGKKIRRAKIINVVIFKFQTLKNHTVTLNASLSKNLLVVLTKDKHFFLTEKVSLVGHKTFFKPVRLVLFVAKKKEKVKYAKLHRV